MFSLLALSTHVAVDVPDLEATTKYLDTVLGLPKLREVTVPGLGRIVFYPGLELTQAKPGPRSGEVKHLAWEVADLKGTIGELRKRGVVFESDHPLEAPFKDTGEMVLYILFKAPVGFVGELIQTFDWDTYYQSKKT